MEKMIVEQQARTGKTKILEIWTEANIVYRRWGLLNCKFQTSEKICERKNIGKSNELSSEEQAEFEAQRIIDRKIREGYRPQGTEQSQAITDNFFQDLPTNFAPSKPFTDPPKNYEQEMEEYCAERKNNGANLWRVVDASGRSHTYTRGVKNITDVIQDIAPIQEFSTSIALLPRSIVSYEFIHYNSDGVELPKDLRGILNDKTSCEKSLARYKKLIDAGSTFAIKVFDVLFLNGVNTTTEEYITRRQILKTYIFDKDSKYKSSYASIVTPHVIQSAREFGWEGLILRKLKGPLSTVEFTLNGKPYRKGAWKLIFTKTDDFFITETQLGSSGRLKGLPAKFHLFQYDLQGNLIDCGWAGPGKVKTETLVELQTEWKLDDEAPGELYHIPPVVVEIVFRNRQIDTNSLEFPVIQRFRSDKPYSECIYERQ